MAENDRLHATAASRFSLGSNQSCIVYDFCDYSRLTSGVGSFASVSRRNNARVGFSKIQKWQ